MQIKCDYCGSMIDETATSCPHCGAKLSGVNRTSDGQPKTIEELQQWYVGHHLPPEEITRFFIGKNIKEPKAFGIYKTDTGDCVVYKNKSTGERVVRYQGADEAYAVNELYQRLKAEIADQKRANSHSSATSTPPKKKKKRGCFNGCLISIIAFIALIILAAIFDNSPPDGYYNYNGTQYYHQNWSWYYYDTETDDWYKSSEKIDITDKNATDYQTFSHEGKDFESTSWYDSGIHSDDSGWDSDSNWDSGGDSWDSGGTDWDSDW